MIKVGSAEWLYYNEVDADNRRFEFISEVRQILQFRDCSREEILALKIKHKLNDEDFAFVRTVLQF